MPIKSLRGLIFATNVFEHSFRLGVFFISIGSSDA